MTREIIEAVPRKATEEYRRRTALLSITAACMFMQAGTFIASLWVAPESAGNLAFLWMDSYVVAIPSAWLNLRQINKLSERLPISGPTTTYTVGEAKGKGRWLSRLLPPEK